MADSQLVHVVKWFPALRVDVEQVHLAIPIGVLTSNQQDFVVRDGDGAAGPKGVLHADREVLPEVLLNFVHLDAVIDLLLSASIESSESVNELITDRASTQIVSFVLHRRDLSPLVLSDVVLLNRAQSLLSRESSKDKDCSFANGDSMSVSTFSHLGLVEDLIFLSEINSSILLWWRPSSSDQNLGRTKSNRG